MLFLSCHPEPATNPIKSDPGVLLQLEEGLSLPYAEVGDPSPQASLTLKNVRADTSDSLDFVVEGPFAVAGSASGVPGNSERTLTVRYTGDMGEPALVGGKITVMGSDQAVEAWVFAVIGDPLLPAQVSWKKTTGLAEGEYFTADFESAPFPHESGSYTDASVAVFVPAGLDDMTTELGAVTWFHGHNGHLDEVIEGQYLFELHGLSGRNAVMIVPQGPYEASDGNFGKLMEPGGHKRLVQDVLSVLYRENRLQRPELLYSVLASHSGGYRAVASILDDPTGLPTDAVLLYDSIYGEENSYIEYGKTGVLRSIYTEWGGTLENNLDVADALPSTGDQAVSTATDDDSLQSSRVTIAPTASIHDDCMWEDRLHTRFLRATPLPPIPQAPADLLATTANPDGTATLTWRDDGLRTWRVEGSTNNATWSLLTDTNQSSATVPATPYLRVRPGTFEDTGNPSDIYGATGSELLIVDGFDRVLGGSWEKVSHDFAARVGVASKQAFSIASDEAIANNTVALDDYPTVIWLSGDESTGDITFTQTQMRKIEAYLAQGGQILISGSEAGYATETDFFNTTLHTQYIADDAGTTRIDGGSVFEGNTWVFGQTYPEDYPDVLDGDTTLLTYDTGDKAAVGWNRQVIVVGFPLEGFDDPTLETALSALLGWLDS